MKNFAHYFLWGCVLLSVFIASPTAAQTISGRSQPLTFKGAAVLELERIQGQKQREAEAARKEAEEAREREQEQRQRLTLEGLGIQVDRLPDYYAIIIGISQYENSGATLPNLEQPVIDAGRLRATLLANYSFDSTRVLFLANPDKKSIIESLEVIAERIDEKDNLLIFYAGHGVYDRGKDFGYWLPADARVDDKSTWLSNSIIKDYLGTYKSKHTLLITDACFSGSIFKSRSVDTAGELIRFHQVYKDRSRRAMTSGSLTTVPDKSVFLETILRVLENNLDVFLTSSQLFTRVYEPVLNNSPARPLYGVIQGVGDEGGDFIFIRKN